MKIKLNDGIGCQPIIINKQNYKQVTENIDSCLLQGFFPLIDISSKIKGNGPTENLLLIKQFVESGFRLDDARDLINFNEIEIDLEEYFEKLNAVDLAIVITPDSVKKYEVEHNLTFESSKVIDGFSTTFRQWRANKTHCQYLHGYDISFEIVFQGDLDEKNWVYDFGFGKRLMIPVNGTMLLAKDWFNYMFDHTTVIAESDPELKLFKEMNEKGLIQLRILPEVGCELFAKFVYDNLNKEILQETKGRVSIKSVTCRENNKNSATYKISK